MKSNYFSLWGLLILGLVIIVIVSFTPNSFCIGSYELKKAPIKSTLTMKDSIPNNTPNNTVEDEVLATSVLKPVETDSLPKSILIFGDSMAYNLALRLAYYAKQNGHTLHSINWDSSTTKHWADSDTLSYFLKKYNVDYVFIVLGSNESYAKKPEVRLPYVKKILEAIGDRPYVWIGPPDLKFQSTYNTMLSNACKTGSFFKTAGMTLKRRNDNIHPTKEASALWMDSIARWMPKSSHPILMDFPSDSIKKANANIISLRTRKK